MYLKCVSIGKLEVEEDRPLLPISHLEESRLLVCDLLKGDLPRRFLFGFVSSCLVNRISEGRWLHKY